ncbi:MAG TPA: hypothetical protein VJ377_02565 [Dehalococcoidales bacterium]|nr:hypothetical protein [Dehalococcoidales bacterium]
MDKKELKELTVSVYDRLNQAIMDGDNEKAIAMIKEMERNKRDFDDSYREWVDLMLTYIADKLGEDAVYEVHRMNGERSLWPRLGWIFGPMSIEDKVRKRAYTWTNWHMANIDEIVEDDEKFAFKLKTCHSGGRIRKWPNHGKTKETHPWSWGQKGVCYYCAHCAVVLETMGIEKAGYPAWIAEQQPDGGCIQYLYKDPEKIPEKYYKRLGLEKRKKSG